MPVYWIEARGVYHRKVAALLCCDCMHSASARDIFVEARRSIEQICTFLFDPMVTLNVSHQYRPTSYRSASASTSSISRWYLRFASVSLTKFT